MSRSTRQRLKFIDGGRGVSEEDIRNAEQRLHVTFPGPYRDFLRDYGGGTLAPETGIGSFFTLDPSDPHNLFAFWRILKHPADRIPPRMMPIGDDGSGNMICISLHGEDKGCICIWDHERELESTAGENISDAALTLVAPDMSSLVRKLIRAQRRHRPSAEEQLVEEGDLEQGERETRP